MPTKYIGDGADEHLVGEGMRGMRGVAEGRGHAHKGALRGLIRLNQAPSSSIKLHQAPSSSIKLHQAQSEALRRAISYLGDLIEREGLLLPSARGEVSIAEEPGGLVMAHEKTTGVRRARGEAPVRVLLELSPLMIT